MTAPTLPPVKLAVYLRVSSEEQRVAGTIETQRIAAERYCVAYDHTPYGWYADDGVSGTVPFAARPEGARLMADARAGHLTTVLIWRLDRFGRNAYEILAALRALQALGVRLVSITEAFDTETPAGRLQINMLASIAEFERDSIVQRATEGISRHLREGGWVWRADSLRLPGHRPGAGRAARAQPRDAGRPGRPCARHERGRCGGAAIPPGHRHALVPGADRRPPAGAGCAHRYALAREPRARHPDQPD
ncbi:MAG TPA: recombinase family protein [Ktedonobacterales bacterium]